MSRKEHLKPVPLGENPPVNVKLQVFVSSVQKELEDERQNMVKLLLEGNELTSRQCEAQFRVTRPVVSRELGELVELGVAVRIGAGRSTRYRLKSENLIVKES
jgi:predicted HTH transcriptional regulator